VVLLAQCPILLADFLEAALSGLPLGPSFAAAASRSAFLSLLVDVPFLAFASLTRNVLEAITGGVAIFAGVATLMVILDSGTNMRAVLHPTFGTGMEWITVSALIVVLLSASAILVALQYFRRRTLVSRYLTAATAVCGMLTTLMPWQPAFAIQKSLSTAPGSAQSITLAFDPNRGRLRRDESLPLLTYIGNANYNNPTISLFLPVHISGLPADSGLQSDLYELRVVESSGRIDRIPLTPRLTAQRNGAGGPEQNVYQYLAVEGELYKRIKDQPVRLEIDYSLTLFKLTASRALPAVNGNQHFADAGWCETRINATETAVGFRCVKVDRRPGCLTFFLEHIPSGQKNPERFVCDADYEPYLGWQLIPDSLLRTGSNLPFRDPSGLAKYPVDGSKLQDSRAVMQVYDAIDHFSRKLVIPEIRLIDWEAAQASD